jgi:hypothetical protein
MEKCRVCGKEFEDMRHVGVECLYDVKSLAPNCTKERVFTEVPEGPVYLESTRHYPEGTVDKLTVVKSEEKNVKINTRQVPVPAIRLLEKNLFVVDCCKDCRGDFLKIFKEWSEGKHIGENI